MEVLRSAIYLAEQSLEQQGVIVKMSGDIIKLLQEQN